MASITYIIRLAVDVVTHKIEKYLVLVWSTP